MVGAYCNTPLLSQDGKLNCPACARRNLQPLVHPQPHHPYRTFTIADQWPVIPPGPGDLFVYKKILQFLLPSCPKGPEAVSWPPGTDQQGQLQSVKVKDLFFLSLGTPKIFKKPFCHVY